MRRIFSARRYVFRPPVARSWVRPFGRLVNRVVHLGRKYHINEIDENGFAAVAGLCRAGHSVMLAPNHSDHSDPHVLVETVARHGLNPFFMGARELFEAHPIAAWALRHMGVFSVDRDGPDLAAIKTAISLLADAHEPLVVFPEGEIYHHHRRLDPLHEGPASIILKAAARVREGKSAFLVPVALSFHHQPEVAETFRDRLSALETRIGWLPRSAMETDARIRRLATGVLALKETEFLGRAGAGDIQQRLVSLCDDLLVEVEARCGRDAKAVTAPERVRALRYRIRRKLLDEENPSPPAEKGIFLDDLDRIFTALQAHSYIGDLLADETIDRRAEMIMKLEEDLFGFPNYPAPRTVRVTAGEPIDVTALLASGSLPRKGGSLALTEMLENRLTEMLQKTLAARNHGDDF
ncbi:MAG: 1-acyl-sn-glycerol-3-phosphate acyltransferase [Verrucomicrobiota bacterium]